MENKKLMFLGGVIIVALIIIVIILSMGGGKFTGFAVTNPIKTCKEVQVPYETQEEYQVPLKYDVVSANKGTTLHGFDVWAVGDVVVRNVDSETGLFTVTQTFETLNKQSQTKKSNQYIMSGETKTFHEEFDINLGEDFNFYYRVTPGEKTLTRTVTKYKTEERCT